MLKILYIVGSGSKNCDWELRWSLRSVDKYALDDVEPVVVGNVPDWFRGQALPCGDKFERKEKNINRKIMKAIEAKLVEGEFQISADDHFWIAPTEFGKLPIVYRDGLLPVLAKAKSNNYERALVGTCDTLVKFKCPRFNTACHCNAWANAGHVDEVQDIIDFANYRMEYAGIYGVVAWAVWPNVMLRKFESERKVGRPMIQIRDLKYRGESDFHGFIRGAKVFSVNDKAFGSQDFLAFMKENFGKASRWER